MAKVNEGGTAMLFAPDLDLMVEEEIARVLNRRCEFGLPVPFPSFEAYEARRAFNHEHARFEIDPIEVHGVVL